MPIQDTQDAELNFVTVEAEPELDTQTTAEEDGVEGENRELSVDDESTTQVAKPNSQADVRAKAQEVAWYNKVIDGKADISEAPKWLQGRLQARFDAMNKLPDLERIAGDVARGEIAKQREDAEFETMQKSLPTMSTEEFKTLNRRFQEFKGLGKVKALRTAMELCGFTPDALEDKRIDKARGRMSLPPSGQSRAKGKNSLMDIAKDQKQWKAFVKSQGDGNIYDEP